MFRLFPALVLCLGLTFPARADVDIKAAGKYLETLKTSKDAKDKANALKELARIGQIQKGAIEEAVPYMMKAMEDKDPSIRAAAARSLGMIDLDADEIVPKLVKLMKDDEKEEVKIGAIEGLGAMGPSAKDAVKELREFVGDKKDKKEKKMDKLARAAQMAIRSIMPKKQK